MSNLKVYSVTSLHKMKSNPHYLKAKQGDLAEAKQLVGELMIGKKFPLNNEILVPVIAQEAAGRNKIPLALAMLLSQEHGNDIEIDIVQAVRANHTGSDAVNRLKNVTFVRQGKQPLSGDNYVIVDDHVTMGGTVSSLAKYIRENGGKVEKVFSLTNNTRLIKLEDGGQDISPTLTEIQEVKRRFGTWLEEYSGMKYEEMSKPTIQYLLKFRTLDNLQKRCKNINSSIQFLNNEEIEDLWGEFAMEFLESLFKK